MKRTTYVIILAIVTIFCIIFGAYINLKHSAGGIKKAGKAVSKAFTRDYLDADDDDDLFDYDDYDDDDDDDDAMEFDSEALSAFDVVSVEGSVLALVISRGSSYSIDARYNNPRLQPEYSLNNGRLRISQKRKIRRLVGNSKCKVTITVPYGVTLDKLDVDVDVGAIELSGFDVDTASISTDVGAISVNRVDFKDMVIKSDVGAVSIELLDDVEKYDINASSDIGSIVVNDESVKRRYNQAGSNGKRLKLNTDVGGIEIK